MRRLPLCFTALCLVACGASSPAAAGAVESAALDPTWCLVELGFDDAGAVLAGEGIEPGQRYATLGPGGSGLVSVVVREPADCDHCTRPRLAADVVHPAEGAIVALGPVNGPLAHARASAREYVAPTGDWSVVLDVDLDGDGTTDLEGVSRCGHEIPSGCSDQVCDRYCHATRTAGTSEVRGERCQDFIPDVDDCAPSNAAPSNPAPTNPAE